MLRMCHQFFCSCDLFGPVLLFGLNLVSVYGVQCGLQADQKRANFFQPEGDHLTLLAVWKACFSLGLT
jgi:hypothetical protein